MTAEDWEEIKRIFDSALKLPALNRAAYLDAACNNKPVLRSTVDELLGANDAASGFLNGESTSPDSLPPVFSPGDIVAGRFRIIRMIARGGMGEVYETFDEKLRARIALKTLRPELASDVDALERFKREILVTRDVGHENLCRVFELIEHHLPPSEPGGEKREVICLTMQLMSGENLQQYLINNGKMSPESALPLVRQIGGAIDALHRNNVIHRDLKPSNVMITPGRPGILRAIVMDFGLARPLGPARDEGFRSRTDANAGAPYFLAPELFGNQKPSIASDIYAFGLIIDEMVTGGGAFAGDSVQQIFSQKLFGEPVDPRKRNPDLPLSWVSVIRRCLHRDPAKRFSSAAEVIAALDDGAKGLTKPLPRWMKPLFVTYRRMPAARFASGHRRILSFLIGILVVSVLGAGWLFQPLKTSVVTFQIQNLTGVPDYDDLCAGITREMERRLQNPGDVAVMPFHAPRPKDSRLKLDARFSIDGYLQKSGNIVQLSMQVIDNTSRRLVAADDFRNDFDDVLQLQSKMAEDVAEAMRDDVLVPAMKSSRGPLPAIAFILIHKLPFVHKIETGKPPTSSSPAMYYYMRAHNLWEQRGVPSLRASIDVYNKALGADRNFALAYADLARVECTLLQYNHEPRRQLFESAKAHAILATQKGPNYAETYAALAVIDQLSWNWKSAETNFKRALRINPALADVHRNYGGFLIQFGRFNEGIAEIQKSISLDPYGQLDRVILSTYLYYAGRYAEGVNNLEGFVPESNLTDRYQELALLHTQMALQTGGNQRLELLQQALKETSILAEQESKDVSKPSYSGLSAPLYATIYALQGNRSEALKYLDLLLAGYTAGAVNPLDIADVYVALGNSETALAFLRKGVDAKDPELIYLKVEPLLAGLRSNSKYQALVKEAGL